MPKNSCDRRLHESWVLRKLILLVACVQANMPTKCIVGRNSSLGSSMFHMAVIIFGSHWRLRAIFTGRKVTGEPTMCLCRHREEAEVSSNTFASLEWMGGQHHAPAALSPGKNRYAMYRRLGGPRGRFGGVQKISPLSGFAPRTVQSVSCRYTEYAILAFSSRECKY
jgi:hypothetical protein